MKIHGMRRMLGALLSVAIVSISCMTFPLSVQAAPTHYSDDAIVRDLKAGKLTVREAQMLQARRSRVEATPVQSSQSNVKHAGHPKPLKSGKVVKRSKPAVLHKTAAHKKNGKAPIRHLTTPHQDRHARSHAKSGQSKTTHAAHVKPVAGSSHKALQRNSAKPHLTPVKMSGGAEPASGHHRAVKYIR